MPQASSGLVLLVGCIMEGIVNALHLMEEQFNKTAAANLMNETRHFSLYISAFYVVTIFSIKKFMQNRPKYDLRQALFMWSLGLALFSIWGFCNVSFFHLRHMAEHGWKASVCDLLSDHKRIPLWTWLFVLSKLPELVDTYFIVLRKQKLIFLHWYHHITVFIYCWYNYSHLVNPQQWFMTMNFLVHSIMYSYYAIRASNIYRPPIWVNMVITSLQLLQMVVATWVNLYVFINMCYTSDWYCDGEVETTYWYVGVAFAMYASYFVLFTRFFYSVYISKPSKEGTTKPAELVHHSSCNSVCRNGISITSLPVGSDENTLRQRN